MPAMLDDPSAPTIHRVSGAAPLTTPSTTLPAGIGPRVVTLRDGRTTATIIPYASPSAVPAGLVPFLAAQLNREIDGGDTYPMMDRLGDAQFAAYWFQNFGAVMLRGTHVGADGGTDAASVAAAAADPAAACLGTFYVKPNYPGRSSHVCNGGFLMADAARGRGVGALLGAAYLAWAPRLGYSYSVFNLVYESNVASCRIWDALAFQRIGRVPGCGNLRSSPGRLVDAIIYGRELSVEDGDEAVESVEKVVVGGDVDVGGAASH